jgi:dienelactone hydrolase
LRTVVYLPPTSGPAPLVILAHGFNGHPRLFTDLARRWAAAGYVVGVPRFPVTNDEFPERDPALYTARVADLGAQAGDVAFVVAELRAANADATSDLAGRLDPERLGLYGLSLGALTVWSAAQRGELCAGEVDALIQSDGAFPGDEGGLPDVDLPVLIAHSDVDPVFPAEAVLREFAALPHPKFLLVLHGADHAAVGENTPTPADEAYRVATTVFWSRYLSGVDKPFPESVLVDGVTTFVDGS